MTRDIGSVVMIRSNPSGRRKVLLAAAALWSPTIADHHQLPFGLRGWPTIVLLLGGYVAGRYLANRPWRVRRTTIAGSAS